MTAIWRNDDTGWQLLAPAGFPDEAALHKLVEQAPQILPLAGSPRLAILGREVSLGDGYVDLLAVEETGRLAIIEIKLASNAEARRAVVSQVLAYAAFLHRIDRTHLEQSILDRHLRERNYQTLLDAATENNHTGTLDVEAFLSGLGESLAEGRFRLVLVLDAAPSELVRLVGYLQTITDKLLIDLITVSAYEVGESRILVPQRVDPELRGVESAPGPSRPSITPIYAEGVEGFASSIEQARDDHRADLQRLLEWAQGLEGQGLARLHETRGKGRVAIRPLTIADGVGLVTIWNDSGPYISLWRSVFERRAPKTLPQLEQFVAPTPVGSGNSIRGASDELLALLTDAYREAADGRVIT